MYDNEQANRRKSAPGYNDGAADYNRNGAVVRPYGGGNIQQSNEAIYAVPIEMGGTIKPLAKQNNRTRSASGVPVIEAGRKKATAKEGNRIIRNGRHGASIEKGLEGDDFC